MKPQDWQLPQPIRNIIFDCDGTLSAIEGIDELARLNGAHDLVSQMTAHAMSSAGINEAFYAKRLSLVKPTLAQMQILSQTYFSQRTPDALEVVQLLKRLNKNIFIVSAGLNPAVTLFAHQFGIPADRVFAVDARFDAAGNYLDFDHHSPLVRTKGKHIIVKHLKEQYGPMIFIGDAVNDLDALTLSERFIGYGGHFYRENMAALSHFYIRANSMTPILPLCLTQSEAQQLTPPENDLFQKGLDLL